MSFSSFSTSTDKTRIQVTLPDDLADALKKVAKRDRVPVATKAMYLIKAAMEIDEDVILDALASEREAAGPVRYLSHEEVWGPPR